MKKILLSVVACCALVAFVPASALAHGHHKRHHRSHHARVRDFGSTSSSQSSQGTSQNQGQTAGTVQSFSNGVLTIALNNGSMVSGTVTGDTEVECQAPETSSSGMQSHDHGGDNSGGDNSGGDNGNSNDQGDDQGQGDDNNANQACDLSTVPMGTVVQEAELRISSAGGVWKKVDLVTASAADTDNDNDSGADNDNDGD
jgi:hypothetical protein